MRWPLLYLIVPMAIACPLQVVHCVLDRGGREAAKWFGWALVFATARELVLENTVPVYRLPVGMALPHFLPVAIGWTFALYAGEMIAGAFVNWRGPKLRPFILPESMKATIACGVTTSIGLAIETVAVGMGWWAWNPAVQANNWMLHLGFAEMPLFVLVGWAGNGFVFPFVFDFLNDPLRAAQYGRARYLILLLVALLFILLVVGNWLFTTSLKGPAL